MPDAYQRLLLDAMNGDASLFARSDEVELAWSIIDPILAAWHSPAAPPLDPIPMANGAPPPATSGCRLRAASGSTSARCCTRERGTGFGAREEEDNQPAARVCVLAMP